MEIHIEHNGDNHLLEKGKKLPYYRGYFINIKTEDNVYICAFFDALDYSSNIELISMRYPNKQNYSLLELSSIADLFPVLKKKYYEQTQLITFEYDNDGNDSPIIVRITEQSFQYVICFAILGGEYSRSPGTSILLIDYKAIQIG